MLTHADMESLVDRIAAQVEARLMAKLAPGRWLTLKEAMGYAKVKSPNTIKGWIFEGYIYAHKRSGEWIVDRESIDKWFENEKFL